MGNTMRNATGIGGSVRSLSWRNSYQHSLAQEVIFLLILIHQIIHPQHVIDPISLKAAVAAIYQFRKVATNGRDFRG